MSAPSTSTQFLELAVKSGLLSPQDLQAYLQHRLKTSGGDPATPGPGLLPKVPRALANAMVRDRLLTRFQVEQLLLGRWRHFILSGKYVVLGPLGSGGMGQVFLCEHKVMRRRVAVKVLPPTHSNNPAALERFHREARAVAQLRHPNIVGGHDVDRDGNVHFLVMEHIDGSTFHKLVREHGPLTPLRAAHYVRQAALGLQHAHEAGLVHRDVKPSNLLLERTGTVKLLDMGLARFFHDETDDLSSRNVETALGTASYMAPEQALDSHAADVRADVYSLGATFYFLLAGQSPSPQGPLLDRRASPNSPRPPSQPWPLRDLRPEVPEGLAAILDRMMAKAPEERFQAPAEVVEALAPWTQAPVPPPPAAEMPELVVTLTRSSGGPTPTDSSATSAVPIPPAFLYGPPSSATSFPWQAGDETSIDASWPLSPLPILAGGPGGVGGNATHTLTGAVSQQGGARVGALAAQPPFPPAGPEDADGAGRPRPTAVPSPVGVGLPPPAPVGQCAGAPATPRHPAEKRRRPWALLGAVAVLLLGALGVAVYVGARSFESAKGPAPVGQTGGPATEAPPRLRLLVPAYFYPSAEGLAQWDRLIDSPAAAATVAIVNPDSGPGTVADPNYSKVLRRARAKGITLIGYVSTKYATRPLEQVKADVDRWARLYPEAQGIFFDEQATALDKVDYYVALYEYVRKHHGLALVVTNPGTVCAEEYLARPASDVVCLAEAPKGFSSYRPPPWAFRYPATRFAALLFKIDSPEQMRAYVRGMGEKRIGYCYVTEVAGTNPWGRLSRYWEAEASAVQQFNAQQKAPRQGP